MTSCSYKAIRLSLKNLEVYYFHTGPYQEFAASLPDDSPELQFGMHVYEEGVMQAEQVLTVTGITIQNEGLLRGVENLVIGPNGKIILRYCVIMCISYSDCRCGCWKFP